MGAGDVVCLGRERIQYFATAEEELVVSSEQSRCPFRSSATAFFQVDEDLDRVSDLESSSMCWSKREGVQKCSTELRPRAKQCPPTQNVLSHRPSKPCPMSRRTNGSVPSNVGRTSQTDQILYLRRAKPSRTSLRHRHQAGKALAPAPNTPPQSATTTQKASPPPLGPTYNGAITGARPTDPTFPNPCPQTPQTPNPSIPPFPSFPSHSPPHQPYPALSTNPATSPSISQTNIPTAPPPHHGCTYRSASM